MFHLVDQKKAWSNVALMVVIVSVVMSFVLSIADGFLHNAATPPIFYYWSYDLRGVFTQLLYAGTVFFVGAKFIETRSIFTIGFDRLDADRVSFKGPDEDNVVWIGHRYGSRLEAEAVAAALESRLNESKAG
jgi:hypothetical protein